MDDKYTQQHFQKFQKKNENKKENIPRNNDVSQKTDLIEENTCSKAKKALKTLRKGSKTQKNTSELIKAQGEQIDVFNEKSHELNVNVKECRRLSTEIKHAGKFFGFRVPILSNIKSYFSKEARMDRKLKRINKKERMATSEEEIRGDKSDYIDSDDVIGAEKSAKHNKEHEDLTGEDKTYKELNSILQELKGMTKESKKQQKLIKSHKGKIGEISRMNDNSEHYMNTTNEELKRL